MFAHRAPRRIAGPAEADVGFIKRGRRSVEKKFGQGYVRKTTVQLCGGLMLFGNSAPPLTQINARLRQHCNIGALVGDLD